MAQIKINDISIAGSDLFSDSESYLSELSNDSEMLNINGGTSVRFPFTFTITWRPPTVVEFAVVE